MSLEELTVYRKYLQNASLDGDNGVGDDGLEKFDECNRLVALIDARIKEMN